ncbi:hypothetical protein [Oryzobacter telluris]|uniref:hypothetical protein n=1 Tax=Oryzobacter telluris TaxID=3149179 RepID=UPI00370D974E
MNSEHLVRAALERSVSGISGPEPDVDALLAAGQAVRVRRATVTAAVAAVVVLVLVGVTIAWTGSWPSAEEPVPAAPSVTREARQLTMLASDPPFLIGGLVQQGRDVAETDARVAQFTVLKSGFVWVEDETSEPRIVFRGWQGGTNVIGHDPWPSVEPLSSTPEHPRGLRRNVVGNPERNWLAWVEQGPTRKRLVVAHAASGAVQRTTIPEAGPEWVDVLSVSAELVYLRRCPAPSEPVELLGGDLGTLPTSRAGCSIWQWSWQHPNAELVPSGHSWVEPDGAVVQDVTTGVWAVTRPGRAGLTFVSPEGGRLSDTNAMVGENEGHGLSPDGRYWFSPGSRSVVVTETGEVRSLSAELSRVGIGEDLRFVWLEPTTVMVIDNDTVTTCDASLVICDEPADVGTLLTRAILPVQ